jgi:hypothetical protein
MCTKCPYTEAVRRRSIEMAVDGLIDIIDTLINDPKINSNEDTINECKIKLNKIKEQWKNT